MAIWHLTRFFNCNPATRNVNQFYSVIDEGKDVRTVYLDISKAFDRVWHKGLLLKLHKFGIGGNLLKWFADYLSNRFQRGVING